MGEELREPSFEPAVMAVELYREDTLHRRRRLATVVGAIVCIALGAGTVLAVLFISPDLLQRKTSSVVLPPSNSIPQGEPTPTPKEPESVKTPETTSPKPEATAKTPDSSPAPVATPKTMPPFNPFAGGAVPEGWEGGRGGAPISGDISVKPEGSGGNESKPPTEPTVATQGASLLLARANGGDPEAEAAQIARALQGAGASVRTSPHYAPSGNIVGVQVVATLPAASLAAAKAKLESTGAQIGESWQGNVEGRHSKVQGLLSARITGLRKTRTDLLVKYLEDAPEIAQIDEEIEKLNQCLSIARTSGKSEKNAVILVGVGSF